MFQVGGPEFLVIVIVALIAVGPDQLPSVVRKIGRWASQFRSVTSGLRSEFMAGIDEIEASIKEPLDEVKATFSEPAAELKRVIEDPDLAVTSEDVAAAAADPDEPTPAGPLGLAEPADADDADPPASTSEVDE